MKRNGFCLSALIQLILAALVGLGWLASVPGCAPNTEPLERTANKVLDTVVAPAVAKALEETNFRTATIQGGAQVIEPGWRIEFQGVMVNGVQGYMNIRAAGVAGQLTGHSQGDNEATPAPGSKPDPTPPEN